MTGIKKAIPSRAVLSIEERDVELWQCVVWQDSNLLSVSLSIRHHQHLHTPPHCQQSPPPTPTEGWVKTSCHFKDSYDAHFYRSEENWSNLSASGKMQLNLSIFLLLGIENFAADQPSVHVNSRKGEVLHSVMITRLRLTFRTVLMIRTLCWRRGQLSRSLLPQKGDILQPEIETFSGWGYSS